MANRAIRVLLVDDDKEDFMILRSLITSLRNRDCCAEYELIWESRYEGALVQVGDYAFDLILVDYSLGDRTGLELLSELRARGINTPVILLTGMGDEWLDTVALKAGVSDYLVKGDFNATVLDRTIRYAIEKHRMVVALKEAELSARGACVELEKRSQELSSLNEKLAVELKERKQLERQLFQSQKMESIGHLAAGVAHEINNPIAFVKCNLSTLGRYNKTFFAMIEKYLEIEKMLEANAAADDDDSDDVKAKIQDVQAFRQANNIDFMMEDIHALFGESMDGIQRVEEIVHGLKCFVRSDEGEMKDSDINECLEKTLKVVWNQLKYRANIHKNFTDLPRVCCHTAQLSQVFMNLLVNAAQAMPENKMGDIYIETYADVKNVTVKISDTGTGIPAEKLTCIFDPFFTTKPVGQGTGLGLSVSYGIIEKHGGHIAVESELGKGTVFTISLPIAEAFAETEFVRAELEVA